MVYIKDAKNNKHAWHQDQAERRKNMTTKRNFAIYYLTFYFKLLFQKAGLHWDISNDADIEQLIDLIINAAAEAAERRLNHE